MPIISRVNSVQPGLNSNRSRRCIFIVIRDALSVRNYLRPDMLNEMKQSGHKFVLLTEEPDAPFLQERFNDPCFSLEALNLSPPQKVRGKFGSFLRMVRLYTYPSARLRKMQTRNFQMQFYRDESLAGNVSWRAHIYFNAIPLFAFLASHNSLIRHALFAIERWFVPRFPYGSLFEKYQPDLLVMPSYGYGYDWRIMLEARRRKTKVLAIVRSWDNPSTKGWAGIVPDRVLTWNTPMAREMEKLHAIPADRIKPIGVPQWDNYFDAAPSISKKDFLASYGLSLEKKTIYFATGSPNLFLHNVDIARDILSAISEGSIRVPAQILIRLHPEFATGGGKTYRSAAQQAREEIENLSNDFPGLVGVSHNVLDRQGKLQLLKDSNQDDLRAMLAHSDTMVTIYSTQILEAAILDCPIINAAYYPFRKTGKPAAMCANFDHIRRIMTTGAVTDCMSSAELVRGINDALEKPDRLKEARNRLVQQELDVNQGCAGIQITQEIIGYAQK
jgi:hypothetical protein